jgi:hypothetical protein
MNGKFSGILLFTSLYIIVFSPGLTGIQIRKTKENPCWRRCNEQLKGQRIRLASWKKFVQTAMGGGGLFFIGQP